MESSLRARRLTRAGLQALSRSRQLTRRGLGMVRSRLAERMVSAQFAPRPDDDFTAAFCFAGDDASLYQLREWLFPAEQLAARLTAEGYGPAPLALFCRSAAHAQQLTALTSLPVRFGRQARDLTAFMTQPQLRIVFYVNQSPLNFQALRFTGPAHVHLSHGESEKISMISNQLKAYDYVFTAGAAARARILQALRGYRQQSGETRMIDVGRPQLDQPRPAPQAWTQAQTAPTPADGTAPTTGTAPTAGTAPMPTAGTVSTSADGTASAGPADTTAERRLTVFYAPTWEGDSPSMAYGTLALNGPAILRGLLDAGCRVIVRPHPRTGCLDLATAQALAELRRIAAEHRQAFFDDGSRIGWQFDAADVCLTEMSALAFDWLSTGKPLVVIRPADPAAEVLAGGLIDTLGSVSPHEPGAVVAAVTTASGTAALTAAAAHYLGDTSPGAQQRRFEDAALAVIAERTAQP